MTFPRRVKPNNRTEEPMLPENQDKVDEYRSGKDKLFGFFVGQVMKRSQGKANPKIVKNLMMSPSHQYKYNYYWVQFWIIIKFSAMI